MIISPSVAQILRGVVHEMGTSLKAGLDDPIKLGQIETICGVLSACAVRADFEDQWVQEEVEDILTIGLKFVEQGKATPALDEALKSFDVSAASADRYNRASSILSLMGDIGSQAGPELSNEVWRLMQQRLKNEGNIIGGGFESAGRG